jgi:hypothetical protein
LDNPTDKEATLEVTSRICRKSSQQDRHDHCACDAFAPGDGSCQCPPQAAHRGEQRVPARQPSRRRRLGAVLLDQPGQLHQWRIRHQVLPSHGAAQPRQRHIRGHAPLPGERQVDRIRKYDDELSGALRASAQGAPPSAIQFYIPHYRPEPQTRRVRVIFIKELVYTFHKIIEQ